MGQVESEAMICVGGGVMEGNWLETAGILDHSLPRVVCGTEDSQRDILVPGSLGAFFHLNLQTSVAC